MYIVLVVTILYSNFDLISFSNSGFIRLLSCCYGNVHLNLHTSEFNPILHGLSQVCVCVGGGGVQSARGLFL